VYLLRLAHILNNNTTNRIFQNLENIQHPDMEASKRKADVSTGNENKRRIIGLLE
jgi:hypothetical protein